jgi:hypothetical protein
MTPEKKQRILEALERRESLVMIHWPRGQPGKARLLVELAQHMREIGVPVVVTDLTALGPETRTSLKSFYLALAQSMGRQLNLTAQATDSWDAGRSPTANFERYVQTRVLSEVRTHLVWMLDEMDVLVSAPFANELMGLLRSWRNRRTPDATGPWSRLTLVLCFSSEAKLRI